ncbi:winged helix-turn-helix transcriptional regulator, partial [Candidatus Bathyarchaeota archaeon]|nr:winged helix-turn-helix transcriptional regulator [Candidatus Bathyarchaeota archaeon]
MIDDLDLRILRCLGEGIYSYNEIAKACGVSRNTVYRRISRLEETGVIRRKLAAVIDYKKLNYSVVIIGIKLASIDSLDKAVSFLKVQHNVKFIWKTYGDHDLIAVIFCDKETVG